MSTHTASSEHIPEWQSAIVASMTAFFLDVDGTLLGFKDRPEDVVADDDLISVLRRLQEVSNCAVALVSGRMVSDLDRIMSPLVLPAAGVHGADLRYADGRREAFQGEALSEVRAAAERFVGNNEGLRFEDKGGATFAVHFRQKPERADDVSRFLEDAIQGHDLMVQRGKMVAEVRPESCHKGIAIMRLMETPPFAGRLPFFMGDDLTDEYGFAAVNDADGVSVKIGGEEENTIARHRLVDTCAVRKLLKVICRSAEVEKYK